MTSQKLSLLELMTALCVVSVLAAIALPKLYTVTMRAKNAEVPVNTQGIADALVAYDASHDGLYGLSGRSFDENPPRRSGAQQLAWDPVTDPNWDVLGWRPNGEVWGTYLVAKFQNPTLQTEYQPAYPMGMTDLDGDGHIYYYLIELDLRAGTRTVSESQRSRGVWIADQ